MDCLHDISLQSRESTLWRKVNDQLFVCFTLNKWSTKLTFLRIWGSEFEIPNPYTSSKIARDTALPSIFKDDFSSRTHPSIFTSITPLLLEQSNETSWVFPALKSPVSQCFVDQIQVQKPIPVGATDQMPDHTYSRNNIIRKVINV